MTARVVALMARLDLHRRDARVEHRARQAAVSEQLLDDAQVCAGLQQMRRATVTDHVRRDRLADAGNRAVALEQIPDVVLPLAAPGLSEILCARRLSNA